jgi:thiamine kinase-like enzyme
MGLPSKLEEIDGAWLSEALYEAGRISEPKGVTVKGTKGLTGGTAFSTTMSILELDGPAGTPATAVIKLPIGDSPLRSLLDGIGAYRREITFYGELAHQFPVRVPEAYVVKMDEATSNFVLILEDLSHIDTPDQIVGLTLAQAEKAVDALAVFHAWSWEHERLDRLQDSIPPLDGPKAVAIYESFTSYFTLLWPQVRDLPMIADEVKTFGDRFSDYLPFFIEQLSTPRTIAHGELRADNMFVPREGDVIIVDFQAIAQQAGIVDLAYLISQSVDEDVRRGKDEDFVRRYQEKLTVEGVRDYPFEQAWEQYRIATAFMLLIPVLSFAAEDVDDRARSLRTEMLHRANDTIMAIGALEALPSPEAVGAG